MIRINARDSLTANPCEDLEYGVLVILPTISLRIAALPLVLVVLASCVAQDDPLLPGGPWDFTATRLASERGVADGTLSFDRSRISVPASYTCGVSASTLPFVDCGPDPFVDPLRAYRTISLGQSFSTKAQLTEAGLWPVRLDEVLARDFREFANWSVRPPVTGRKRREFSRVAPDALPAGAEACIRFYLSDSAHPPGELMRLYQLSGLYCMRRTQDPPGLLTVAGKVSESAEPARRQRLSPDFDHASEPVLRTLELIDGKEPDEFGSRWFEANPPSRASASPR